MNQPGNKRSLPILLIGILLFLGITVYQPYDTLSEADFLFPGLHFQNQDMDNQPVNKKVLIAAWGSALLLHKTWTCLDALIPSGAHFSRSLIEQKTNLRC
jgi:hypothetical protein